MTSSLAGSLPRHIRWNDYEPVPGTDRAVNNDMTCSTLLAALSLLGSISDL